MTSLNIHDIECPECSANFYVGLPKEDEDVVQVDECVECESLIQREYSFDHDSEVVKIDCKVSVNEE